MKMNPRRIRPDGNGTVHIGIYMENLVTEVEIPLDGLVAVRTLTNQAHLYRLQLERYGREA